MTTHSPYQTTEQNIDEVLSRDSEQRANQGVKKLVSSKLIYNGEPGSGQCKWGAEFTYDDGTIETSWGS